jgi:hypothetical protein
MKSLTYVENGIILWHNTTGERRQADNSIKLPILLVLALSSTL